MADYNPLGKARFPYNQETDGGEVININNNGASFESAVARTFQELLDLPYPLLMEIAPLGTANNVRTEAWFILILWAMYVGV